MKLINIYPEISAGKIKPVHGINNGPVSYGAMVDVSSYYKEIRFPFIRLHDTNWPYPREVDIYTIFPDFSKNPADTKSYDFSRTDTYISSILTAGSKIVFRLGVSIEHTKKKYYVHPPEDPDKWAKICLGIIKHYNDGWAKGFKYNIKYWEIWNEPDNPDKNCMWTGTVKAYLELYKAASRAIKKYDPELKVGGFSATMVNPEFDAQFFKFCRKNKLPLDFFSWHTYTADPEKIKANANYVKEMLVRHGYLKTESHFNEWNYWPHEAARPAFRAGNEYNTERTFERAKSEEGASFDAGILLLLQDLPVDVANYYDGQPTSLWSLFNNYGVPQKNYYAFKAFKELYNYRDRIKTEIIEGREGFFCCAGIKRKTGEIAVLMSNFSEKESNYKLNFTGKPGEISSCNKYVLDRTKNLEFTGKRYFKRSTGLLISVKKHSVVLLKIK